MKILNRFDFTKIIDGQIKEPMWRAWMKKLHRLKSLTAVEERRISDEIDIIIHRPYPDYEKADLGPKIFPTEKQ